MATKLVNTSAVPVWNVETLRAYVLELFEQFNLRMNERHESSLRALDVAFAAQTTAMQTAFASQKSEVTAALASADRAVGKAESAAEKRFESVNEFRATLADQQRTLMPRAEAEAIILALKAEHAASVKVLSDKIEVITAAQIAATGQKIGEKSGWQWAVGIVGLIALVLGIYYGFHK